MTLCSANFEFEFVSFVDVIFRVMCAWRRKKILFGLFVLMGSVFVCFCFSGLVVSSGGFLMRDKTQPEAT